ncbi:hypothetical protein SGPA1_11964 [Streptomyces misionensis JCM 4497]
MRQVRPGHHRGQRLLRLGRHPARDDQRVPMGPGKQDIWRQDLHVSPNADQSRGRPPARPQPRHLREERRTRAGHAAADQVPRPRRNPLPAQPLAISQELTSSAYVTLT